MDEIKILNNLMKICHPETHEMITNAERAYLDGLITREQRNDAIMAAIQAETESKILGGVAAEIERT